jgi:molecular chaperone DnaK
MVGESVEFAFEDMAERIFTEAKMKADELLPAVEMILEQGFVVDKERSEIEEAVSKVKSAIISKNANALKAAVKLLDEATEAAAARLVERAMEEALEREMTQ